jgi:hypothetical protein
MGRKSWFRGLLKSLRKRATHAARKQKGRRYPLVLEALEDRVVPSLDFRGVPTWTFQGPAPIVKPSSGFREVGAIQHVAADRYDANNLFVATVNGGIWRTRNALAGDPTQIKWTPLTDQYPSLSIGSV